MDCLVSLRNYILVLHKTVSTFSLNRKENRTIMYCFVDQALKYLDYEVRDKLFAEALLDIESSDVLGKAVFYIDTYHSFDEVLLKTLQIHSVNLLICIFIKTILNTLRY